MKPGIVMHCLLAAFLLVASGSHAQISDLLPKPPRDPRPAQAREAFDAGRFEVAEQIYLDYLEDQADNAEAWLFLGLSRYRQGRFPAAREAFLQTQTLEPDSIDAQVALGYVALQESGPAMAARYFGPVVENHPQRIDALQGMVLAGRRSDAPPEVVQAGSEAARRLEARQGRSIDLLLAANTLEAGKENKIRPEPVSGPLRVLFRSGTNYLEVLRADGTYSPIFVKGINLSATLPGRYAGEAPTDESVYREWLAQMAGLGANTVRVYTLLPPAFYRALSWHNADPELRPLWLIQGIASETPEDGDFADPAYVAELQAEITRTIDVVHGNIGIGPRPARAWGAYDHNVSRFVLAFVLGQGWPPHAVRDFNAANPEQTAWNGTRFAVSDARAMEIWVARMLEFAADYEANQYRMLRPIAFTNWPTLDPLTHPTEATWAEQNDFLGRPPPPEDFVAWNDDEVTLDATRISATEQMPAGTFAAYHIYPYYPDFMNNEYREAQDDEGPNQYIGYLEALKTYHGVQPVLVAEFGVPSSRGIAHVQPLGWNQGGHDEVRQGRLVARMLNNIYAADYAGGIVFEFLDQWFKTTWNTAPLEIPAERRRLWFNAQSPDQAFGLMAVRPGRTAIVIDGATADWNSISVLATD